MPTYLSDQPDITKDILDLRRRISILENNQSTGGTSASTQTVITNNQGALPPGGVTYAQLNGDVTTTFDSRYVNVTGDSMSGALTVGSTFGATGATTLGNSLSVATDTTVGGQLTVSGGRAFLTAANAGIELGSPGQSNGPYVDFHSSISTTNYDVRLIAAGGTSADGVGTLSVLAQSISLPTINNSTNISNSLTVTGNNPTSLGGTLTVTGLATFQGGFSVTGAESVSGNFSTGGTLTATGTAFLNGGIGSTVVGQTDSTYLSWDAGSTRFGFSKKTGAIGKLAYANGTFAITQYVGQTTIDPVNTQTDRLTIDPSGLLTVYGGASFASSLTVSGTPTFATGLVLNAGIASKDVITGGGGAGVGNLAGQTVDTYNLKDGSVTNAKFSPGALSSAGTPSGTANNQRARLLRYVTANPATKDAAGQSLDNITIQPTAGIATARVIDGQAYGSNAIKVTASGFTAASGTQITDGIFYGSDANDYTGSPGLAPGQYRCSVYVKLSSAASNLPVIGFDAHDASAATLLNDGVLYTFNASDLSTYYVGVSFPIYVQADTRGTTGLQIRGYYLTGSGADVSISHIQIEPWSGLTQGEVSNTYIKNLSVTNAKISDLQADKITTGTLFADVTQSGTIRTGPDTGARMLLNAGGLYAYSSGGTSNQTLAITNLGNVTLTGTVNATGGAFTGVVTGGTFRGGTFETAAGNVSTVRFDSTGIKGWSTGGVNTFGLDTAGNFFATAATITGTVNATSGTFSGTLYGTVISGASIRTTSSLANRNPELAQNTTDWFDVTDGSAGATASRQTGVGWATTKVALDSGPNGRNGAIIGSPILVNSPFAGESYALQFDGVDRAAASQTVDCGVTNGLDVSTAFTLEAKVQTGATIPSTGEIIAGRYKAAPSQQPILYLSGSTPQRFAIQTINSVEIKGTTTPQPNTNYDVAATYDGTTIRLFVNGALEAAVASGPCTPSSSVRFMIGLDDDATGHGAPWLGIIDEVRLSNIARYTANYTPTTVPFKSDANTLGLWHLDSISTPQVSQNNAIQYSYIQTTAPISAPVQAVPVPSATGGAFAAGTYYWVVTATNAVGETNRSNEQVIAATVNGTVTISWNTVSGATGYKIYRGTAAGAENALVGTVGVTTSFTDTGAAGSAGSPPGSNQSGNLRTYSVLGDYLFASNGTISAGTPVVLSFYARLISGDPVHTIAARHTDGSQLILGPSPTVSFGTTWNRYTLTGVTARDTDSSTALYITRVNLQSASVVQVTGVQIELGTQATAYSNGQQRIDFDSTGLHAYNLSGQAVTTIDSSTGIITATNVNLTGTINATGGVFSGAITASSMTLTGGTFSSTSIQASTIDATNNINAASLTSGTLSTGRISVAAGLGDNNILNGGFEDANPLASWTPNYEATGAATTWVQTTTSPYAGGNRAEVSLATNTGNSLASSSIPVAPGDTWSINGRVRAEGANPTTGTVYVRLYYGTVKDFARGNLAGTTGTHTTVTPGVPGSDSAGYSDLVSGNTIAANTWVQVDGTVTVPAGVSWMRLAVYGWINGTGAWVFATDEWKVRRQLTGTTIADGAITTRTMTAGTISGTVISTNSLTADKISTGTLNASTLIYIGGNSGAHIEIDARPASEGLRLYNGGGGTTVSMDATSGNVTITGSVNISGTSTFSGNINSTAILTGGTINGANITGTTVTGGTIQTATGGSRLVLTSGSFLQLYAGNNPPAYLQPYDDGAGNSGVTLGSSTNGQYIILSPNIAVMQGVQGNFSVNANGVGISSANGYDISIQAGASNYVRMAGGGATVNGTLSGNGIYDSGNRVYSAANAPPTPASAYFSSYVQSPNFYDSSGTRMISTGAVGGVIGSVSGGYTHVNCALGYYIQFRDFNDTTWAGVQGGAYTTMSSAELKKNVVSHTTGLDAVLEMRPVAFKYKWDTDTDADRYGLIAEEIERLVPHAVNRGNSHSEAGIDYAAVTSVLIRAIQDLNAKIEALTS